MNRKENDFIFYVERNKEKEKQIIFYYKLRYREPNIWKDKIEEEEVKSNFKIKLRKVIFFFKRMICIAVCLV